MSDQQIPGSSDSSEGVKGRGGWSGLEERYGEARVGKLACLDRMIIYGTLQGLCHTGAMVAELRRLGVGIFDLKELVQPLTGALRARAEELAKQAAVPIEFLRDWRIDKEDLAKERLHKGGSPPGLVCIFSAMENCQTFEPRKGGGPKKQPWLKATTGRCLHYFFTSMMKNLG